jgi:hypothetical protein
MTVLIYHIGDIIGLLIVLAVCIMMLCSSTATARRQRKCKHLRVFETQACDAVCRDCGKNLGFIGTWREREKRA